METNTKNRTLSEIRIAGIEVLSKKLGVVDMIRFLQYGETGYGDYSKDRHSWLGNPSIDQVINDIENMKK